MVLFGRTIGECVADDDPVRLLDQVVESLDLSELQKSYEAGKSAAGAPPYSVEVMLKLLFWGYSNGVYASRRRRSGCATTYV